ncbi:hypothetical protein SLA2020_095200 [Shorea laevis]
MKKIVLFGLSILLFFIVFSPLRSVSALPQNGPTGDHIKFVLGEENIGPWKNEISEAAEAPGPTSTLVLAANRTKRPDVLCGFRRYLGGWDINNQHYWASVGFTGAAGFILAVLWFVSFGFVLAIHHCCGWRINIKNHGAHYSQGICLIMLILFTFAAAIGCILLSVGQDKFHVFDAVRLALLTVAALMLLLSLVGLLLSVLGHQHAIHIFVVSGWILVAVTFILCGVFVIFNNAISDTCMAMEERVENPQAETALSNILPCVDQRTTNHSLIQSNQVINDLVNVVNTYIYTFANSDPSKDDTTQYYNQSGPPMPPLCYPFDSQLQDRECTSQEVSVANASLVWKDYMCNVSASGQCVTVGRVTPDIYNQLAAAVNESNALEHYAPPLLSFQDCNFVRETFQNIASDYCPPLEQHLKLVNAGLGLISVGVLLCLVLWILYANRPQREEVFAKLSLPIKCWSHKNNSSTNSNENIVSNMSTGV